MIPVPQVDLSYHMGSVTLSAGTVGQRVFESKCPWKTSLWTASAGVNDAEYLGPMISGAYVDRDESSRTGGVVIDISEPLERPLDIDMRFICVDNDVFEDRHKYGRPEVSVMETSEDVTIAANSFHTIIVPTGDCEYPGHMASEIAEGVVRVKHGKNEDKHHRRKLPMVCTPVAGRDVTCRIFNTDDEPLEVSYDIHWFCADPDWFEPINTTPPFGINNHLEDAEGTETFEGGVWCQNYHDNTITVKSGGVCDLDFGDCSGVSQFSRSSRTMFSENITVWYFTRTVWQLNQTKGVQRLQSGALCYNEDRVLKGNDLDINGSY
eukprot:Clim_evm5s36 gene=Clim_evmTU5s36